MASDVTGKSGPLWKPQKLTKQGVPDLGYRKGRKPKPKPVVWRKALPGEMPELQAKWRALRAEFVAETVNDEGFWPCGTRMVEGRPVLVLEHGCGRWLTKSEVTADHIIKRSVRPGLVFEKTNLQILDGDCHMKKDSGFNYKQSPNNV